MHKDVALVIRRERERAGHFKKASQAAIAHHETQRVVVKRATLGLHDPVAAMAVHTPRRNGHQNNS